MATEYNLSRIFREMAVLYDYEFDAHCEDRDYEEVEGDGATIYRKKEGR